MTVDNYTDHEVIGHLDFAEEFACEHSNHQWQHEDEPATYYVEYAHPACGFSKKYMICLSGWLFLTEPGSVYECFKGCSQVLDSDEVTFTILDVLV